MRSAASDTRFWGLMYGFNLNIYFAPLSDNYIAILSTEYSLISIDCLLRHNMSGFLPFSIKAFVAELLATAIFVYIGCGMCV